ncbi:hypothetical protein BKA65DRAFT_544900 [Rhexocercosporidium sp. MPI-PUGE-AT-0058]|nr:hypothetical protein BKA65DRAFT_544900 [Rhexocercosporidium sp. MPI-PUGE-AT-0058]
MGPYHSHDERKKMVRAELQRRIELSAKKTNRPSAKDQKVGDKAKRTTGDTAKVVPSLIDIKETAAYRIAHGVDALEVRKNILRYCFIRLDGIVPSMVKYELYTFRPINVVSVDQYVWESRRQSGCDEQNLPHYDGSPEILQHSWSTGASEGDLKCLEDGTAKSTGLVGLFELPSNKDNATGAITKRYLQQRDVYPSKVVHKTSEETTGIIGVAMLQACRSIHELGCEILYGGNMFVVDTCGAHTTTRPLPTLAAQMAVDLMFAMDQHHCSFIHEDPLASFFRRIGPKNTAFITRLRIEGSINYAASNGGSAQLPPIDLIHILPVQAMILAKYCPNLEYLCIYQAAKDKAWSVDKSGALAKNKEKRIDGVIGDMFKALETLQEVELNGPTYRIEYEEESEET